MQKTEHLYTGKSKSIFATNDPKIIVLHFLDELTAFDGKKRATCDKKGIYNNRINAHFMERLAKAGLPVHHRVILNERESLAVRLNMLKIEFVVRNIAAGSICKRLGIAKGTAFKQPVCEYFLKDDRLGDPLINTSHIKLLELATPEQVKRGTELSLEVNRHLMPLLADYGIDLIDFKLEFGVRPGPAQDKNDLFLGDEITPDSCRFWGKESSRRFDKDVFRYDLGDLGETYRALMEKLGIKQQPQAGGTGEQKQPNTTARRLRTPIQ